MEGLDIHDSYTLRNWVNLYQQKIQTGLITLPAMNKTQKQDVLALKQRNEELEKALQQANLLILALNTMIEVAENDGAARAAKATNPKKVCGAARAVTNGLKASRKRDSKGKCRKPLPTVWGEPTSLLSAGRVCPTIC
ncbi:hypothetical protein SAMN06269250_0844 [Spirosoma fluviale]|uniref:Transposase n=2 Tax=Spirosoma fluviale TaxID=1597977 RepID=A0A286F7I5_9BACT|nr:hypothetical protein SAMN06269250_0844 [Spirosoma fluviale]